LGDGEGKFEMYRSRKTGGVMPLGGNTDLGLDE
jgi:hypothetical protein